MKQNYSTGYMCTGYTPQENLSKTKNIFCLNEQMFENPAASHEASLLLAPAFIEQRHHLL